MLRATEIVLMRAVLTSRYFNTTSAPFISNYRDSGVIEIARTWTEK
jgi:hypothetical protein